MATEPAHDTHDRRAEGNREGVVATIAGMARQANPRFAAGVVVVPLLALLYATEWAPKPHHMYVHVMAGVLWTGIDVFFGLVLGPVIGGLGDEQKARIFQRLTPKMAFLLPILAVTTIFGGVSLAIDNGEFPHHGAWLAVYTAANLIPALLLIGWNFGAFRDWRWLAWQAVVTVGSLAWIALTYTGLGRIPVPIALALVIVTILTVQGFGILMPGEVRVYREMRSADPDFATVSRVGMRNARLSGVQGVLQVCLIAVMVWIAAGSFPL